ncbi:DNA-3-methyladenine glycosylase I (plasmid) [Aggregatilineales bacterium SYSU G02658]
MTDRIRCPWCGTDPVYVAYHDEEWGVPLHDDRALFEFLCLEGAEAGLSWITVLKKRPRYREVFDNFDIAAVAAYDDAKIAQLLVDPGIIRSRAKVESHVNNARRALEVQAKYGSLDAFLWQFVDGRPIQNAFRTVAELPAETPESLAMSKTLKQHGFSFVGGRVCYALMQAVGMVNDHLVTCFRYEPVRALGGG